MSDSDQGGYEADLRQSEGQIEALADSPALATAFRRHAEAQRNMMQGALVPMFVEMVERSMGRMLAPLGDGLTALRSEVGATNRHFQHLSEALDQLSSVVETTQGDVGRLSDKIDDIERGAKARYDGVEAKVARLEQKIDDNDAAKAARLTQMQSEITDLRSAFEQLKSDVLSDILTRDRRLELTDAVEKLAPHADAIVKLVADDGAE